MELTTPKNIAAMLPTHGQKEKASSSSGTKIDDETTTNTNTNTTVHQKHSVGAARRPRRRPKSNLLLTIPSHLWRQVLTFYGYKDYTLPGVATPPFCQSPSYKPKKFNKSPP